MGFIRFFGALIAGFVAGYLMLLLKKLLEKLPKIIRRNKTGTVISILWNFTDGCDYDLPRKSTNRSI